MNEEKISPPGDLNLGLLEPKARVLPMSHAEIIFNILHARFV